MRPSASQMAALKSRPSLTTSEWPTRSSMRPISSTTLMKALRSTSNVIGSIRPGRMSLSLIGSLRLGGA